MFEMDSKITETSINFDEVRNAFNEHVQQSAHVWKSVNALQELNNEYLTSLRGTHRQIKEITDIKDLSCGTSSIYVSLKDKYEELQKQYNEIATINKSLESAHALQTQKLIDKHNTELETIKQQLLEKDAKLENINNDIKKGVDSKELAHLEELQKIQSTASIKYTEMEKNLQKLIHDANTKLRELGNSNNTLRSELINYKSQYNFTVNNNEKENIEKLQRLEVKLLYTENQLKQAKEKLFESRYTNIVKYATKKTKYTYTNNAHAKLNIPDADNQFNQLQERTVIEEESSNNSEVTVKNENVINVPSAHLNINLRKRKLFNRDDLGYLLNQ